MVGTYRIMVRGFGGVGRRLVQLLFLERQLTRLPFKPVLVAVTDSRGSAVSRIGFRGWEIEELLTTPRGGLYSTRWGSPDNHPLAIAEQSMPDVIVDVTPSNYEHPDLSTYDTARKLGISVVTANKAPLSLYPELLTGTRGQMIYYKATVTAGTPTIDVIRYSSKGRRITRIQGVMNSTTTYILTRLSVGLTFDEALQEARELGLVEADERLDIDCIDPAAKAAILSTTAGRPTRLGDVERTGIRGVEPGKDDFIRCVATIDVEGGRIRVGPERIPPESPLRLARGKANAVIIEYADGGRVVLSGPGGGPTQTAMAIISDLALSYSNRVKVV